jgi:hypothetical protein
MGLHCAGVAPFFCLFLVAGCNDLSVAEISGSEIYGSVNCPIIQLPEWPFNTRIDEIEFIQSMGNFR